MVCPETSIFWLRVSVSVWYFTTHMFLRLSPKNIFYSNLHKTSSHWFSILFSWKNETEKNIGVPQCTFESSTRSPQLRSILGYEKNALYVEFTTNAYCFDQNHITPNTFIFLEKVCFYIEFSVPLKFTLTEDPFMRTYLLKSVAAFFVGKWKVFSVAGIGSRNEHWFYLKDFFLLFACTAHQNELKTEKKNCWRSIYHMWGDKIMDLIC